MTARNLSPLPLRPDSWLVHRDVRMLTPAQRGCLVDLWCHYWVDGPLENNPEQLQRLTSGSRHDVFAALEVGFVLTSEGWEAPELREGRRSQILLRETRRENGRLGAEKRWSKQRGES